MCVCVCSEINFCDLNNSCSYPASNCSQLPGSGLYECLCNPGYYRVNDGTKRNCIRTLWHCFDFVINYKSLVARHISIDRLSCMPYKYRIQVIPLALVCSAALLAERISWNTQKSCLYEYAYKVIPISFKYNKQNVSKIQTISHDLMYENRLAEMNWKWMNLEHEFLVTGLVFTIIHVIETIILFAQPHWCFRVQPH